MSIVRDWIIRTVALRIRSADLRTLDTAVNTWATKGQGPKDQNMKDVWRDFQPWKKANPLENKVIKAAADELQKELATVWNEKPKMMAGVGASALKPIGWQYQAYDNSDLLPQGQQLGELTMSEIAKINEAMMRAPSAVAAAHKALTRVGYLRRNGTPANELTMDDKAAVEAFANFFGAYDADRFERIADNFQVLVLAFKNTPKFADWRNDRAWKDTYGGCVRDNLGKKDKSGTLNLTEEVEILFGRAFLGKGNYEKTSDDTVATLVHEFAHGSIDAVDVPDVDDQGNFQCGRQSDDPKARNFGNSTDAMNHQCSNERMDKVLAKFKPEYAVVNADNYAQFTKTLLIAKKH
jgi:hypothetical protein